MVFFSLAVVIPQSVIPLIFQDDSDILFLFRFISLLNESDINFSLQVRLWDISSGALLDTCEVANKVFQYFLEA